MGYYSMVGMAILLMDKFSLTEWYWYILLIPAVFILRYIAGLIDDLFILAKEQDQYFHKNPGMKMLNDKIDKLLNK